MKEIKKKPIVVIFILLASIATFVVNLVLDNKEAMFISFVVFFTLSILFETIYIRGYTKTRKISFLENRMKLWNSISYRVKNAGETSFNEMPLGIVVFDEQLEIQWANNYAKEIFMSPLVGRNIKNIDQGLTDKIVEKENDFVVPLYGLSYQCRHLIGDNVIYLTDITEQLTISTKYDNRMLALGILNLDNLTAAFASLDAQEKSFQMSNLIGILSDWAEKYNVSLTGYSEERYLLIMDQQSLDVITKSEFDILEEVREYATKENLRMTASLGVACSDVDAISLLEDASTQLKLALNRGGNQAVVKVDEEVFYFGATTESFEARNAVSVRLKTEEFKDLVIKSSNVIILSHSQMDADAFGASIAVMKVVKSFGREAQIAFDEHLIDQTVATIYDSIVQEHINFSTNLLSIREATNKQTDNTLLVLVDCQYQSLLMDEKLYKKAKRIAIIDHHRRNSKAINNFDYIYTQPSASSSVELVIEMLDYLDKSTIDISSIEATWMLMGVMVDTNNFVYRTTSRTFHVLARLQAYGANMSKVQRYLREDLEEFVKRVSVLNNIEMMDGYFAIALCDDEVYSRAFLAKVADDMVNVKDIKVAFCIGKIANDEIGISARSLDDANVQVIMEKMGGGGHFTNAAAQIKHHTIFEVREQLIKVLQQSVNEGDVFMKIILTKDVKGKGKARDIIDIPAGHANFLIRSQQAIEATPDNIKHLEYEKVLEKQKQENHYKDMQELKKKIETSPITVPVKVGKAGKLFGSVSTKQVAEELLLQHNITIDKRKILADRDIDSLGTHKILIQLHKEITATITLYVIEKV